MGNHLNLHRALLSIAAVIIILAGIKLAAEIVVPFLLALFIAIICSPIIKSMTARRVPHWLAMLLLFVLISLIFFFLVGLINSSVREFSQSIPQYKTLLSERINDVMALIQRFNVPIQLSRETVQDNFDPSVIMNFVSSLLLNFSGVVSNTFVLILVVVFMLAEAPTMKRKFACVMGSNPNDAATKERHIDRVLQGVIGYLGIKSITSLLTGISIFILLETCGVQYAILWATLSFLLNYIPNIGSVIAAIPIIVQALLLNGFGIGFSVAVGVIAVNLVIGNILEPKMMGQRLGLSTLVVFLSLLFWGWLLGTVGMLLSVPLTMVLKIALESGSHTVKYAALLGDVEERK